METLDALVQAYKLGQESLLNFRQLFLPTTNDVKSPEFHKFWDDILLKGKKNFAIEAFRECGKSILVIRAHTLYRLVYPSPDYSYIILILANQRSASKRLKDVADEYLSDPNLCANLIRVREQSEKAFDIECLDTNGVPRNVRIEAHGKGSSSLRGSLVRGMRPSIVVCDDLQSTDDVASELITERDYEWFLSDVVFLGKDTRIFMIANNLGERSLIERVILNAEHLGFDWARIPILNEEGESNWPEKYTKDFIEQEKEAYSKMGTLDVWFRERMCIALSPDSQRFKPEMFKKRYSSNDIKQKDLSVYITVDLAISQKLTADFTVICVVGVDSENNWFILDIIFGRFDPTETMDKIFQAVSKHKPIKVGVERVAYQAAMEHFLIKEMPKRNIYFGIQPLFAEKKKELRIEQLQPRFNAGTIWLPEEASWLSEFEAQFIAFPRGNKDDIPDALAYMEQIAIAPSGSWAKVDSKDLPIAGSL